MASLMANSEMRGMTGGVVKMSRIGCAGNLVGPKRSKYFISSGEGAINKVTGDEAYLWAAVRNPALSLSHGDSKSHQRKEQAEPGWGSAENGIANNARLLTRSGLHST